MLLRVNPPIATLVLRAGGHVSTFGAEALLDGLTGGTEDRTEGRPWLALAPSGPDRFGERRLSTSAGLPCENHLE